MEATLSVPPDLDELLSDLQQDKVGDANTDEHMKSLVNNGDLDSISKLQKTQKYIDVMQKVEDALQIGSYTECQLILDCNTILRDIENEISTIHNFIRDKYRLKFPELDSIVQHSIDYARIVKKIGNEMDLTLVDLQGLLPSRDIMVVSITASTTHGTPLPEDVLENTIKACDQALALDAAKGRILDYIESGMRCIAPNLSAVVGSAVAAKLIESVDGGLTGLANMPACNVMQLGAKKRNLAGFSSATTKVHRVGHLEQTEIYQSTPPSLRSYACRVLAARAILAARVDFTRGELSGNTGRALREEILRKIEKRRELPPGRRVQPLLVPDSQHKRKKRGGRRARKSAEKYAETRTRRLANRMQFGVPEPSSLGDGLGVGYGMLGQGLHISARYV